MRTTTHKNKLLFVLLCATLSLYAQEKIDTSGYFPGDLDYNLIIATEKNYMSEVKRLIEKGANVNAETWEGVSPLMYAVQNENIDIANFLLEKGSDPNKKPINGVPPLIAAVKTENLDLVELLIRNNANVNSGDNTDITPLMYAAAFNNFTLTDMLIYYDAWLNLQDKNGNTALLVAAYYGYFDIVELLVHNGANIELSDKKDITPIYVAAQNGNTDIVKYLFQNGADINRQNKYGFSPLYVAIQNDHSETSKYILENFNFDLVDQNEKKELMDLALEHRNNSIIHYLKIRGVKVDRKPKTDSYLVEYAMHFSSKDAFAGGLFGVNDKRYKLYAGIGFYRRISPTAILEKKSETEFYQFWEKRSIFTTRLGRYIYIMQNRDYNLYVKPFVSYSVSTGKFKGTNMFPGTLYLFTPGIDLAFTGNNFGISINYLYTDLKTYAIPDHRFGFSLQYKFRTNSNLRNSKKVIWYL